MANLVVIGMQWGDEGKGKIVDLLCPAFDAVVRYQGGHNAGHTVKFGDRHFSLHLIPSGILHPGVDCVLGNGMVLAPDAFFAELDRLRQGGVVPEGRLWVSTRVPILVPDHARLDRAREEARGSRSIGTTSRGIGPAYESKVARLAVRAGELGASNLGQRLADLSGPAAGLPGGPTEPSALLAQCREWGERLAPFLADTAQLLVGWLEEGKSLLFEGAQGALLDVDHGTFPFVTSSNTTAGAAATGSGVPPMALDGVLGVVKAYTTRVGGGPFTVELHDEAGAHLRRRGNEFGTTTGRPRRCGWFDAVAARYARRINGARALALTKLDVLDEFEEIRICTAYRLDGREIDAMPASLEELERAAPVYRSVPGWRQETAGILEFERLPERARAYVECLEQEVGAPISLVSTGPRREETLLRESSGPLAGWLGSRLAAVLQARG
ncbi:MAG TPA: adenylosuccinate synthase [Thermoanaerobaculia bacterium]|nr:adenylosuccinate synthase [Thermoanaerobaculia bacterium]